MSGYRVLLLFALMCGVGACLPGERDNTVPPDTGAASDGAINDAEPTTDTSDGTARPEDTAQPPDAATATDAAALPMGCTTDVDCQVLAVSPCVVATCELDSGLCQVDPRKNGTPCKQGDVCVVNTTCKGGVCAGDPKDCDDSNSCTADLCLAYQGCVNKSVDKPCDDNDPCTLSDACKDGACAGIPRLCDSGLPCRIASCNPNTGDCVNDKFEPEGKVCDDADPCTKKDACDAKGTCAGVEFGPGDCDDSNPCTVDSCKKVSGGCVHIEVVGLGTCDDGDVCTADSCNDGKCVSVSMDCNDGNACTKDACAAKDGKASCDNSNLDNVNCTDSAPCAVEAVCLAGSCTATKAKVCDDGNPCTTDSCNPQAGGCLALAIGGACNDGDGCTDNDKCSDGKCGGTPKNCDDSNPCTVDICVPLAGQCSSTNAQDGADCGGGKSCKGGVCGGA